MKRKAKPSKELVERIALALREVGEQIAVMREMIASHFDLARTDRTGLDFIYSRGGACTAGELSKATGLTSGSTTALIDRLEEAGYVAREPDREDRRKQIVRIPDRVLADCEAVYEPIRREMFRLWSSYSVADLQLVEDFLTRSIQLHGASVQRRRARASHTPQHSDRPIGKDRVRAKPARADG